MSRNAVLDEFESLAADLARTSNPHRPFYKPVLLAWAVEHASRSEPRLSPLDDVEAKLNSVLAELNPRVHQGIAWPWRKLIDNGVWEAHLDGVDLDPGVKRRAPPGTVGGLLRDQYNALAADPDRARRTACEILNRYLDPGDAQLIQQRLGLLEGT